MSMRRIVSLVPSLTKTLCDIGLEQELVGCTNYCVDPPRLRKKIAAVGGTKDADLQLIADLRPTHILTNDEENTRDLVEGCQVIATTIRTFPKSPADVPAMFKDLAKQLELTGDAADCSDRFGKDITTAISKLNQVQFASLSYVYFIWKNPYMLAGHDTYINNLLKMFNLSNAAPPSPRYPSLNEEQLAGLNTKLFLLSSEPYPFRKRDVRDLAVAGQNEKVHVEFIDGKLCSWWGSVTLEALAYIQKHRQAWGQ